MGIYLNFGNKGFEQSLRSDIYVDKTGLIRFVNKLIELKCDATVEGAIAQIRKKQYVRALD